MTRIAYLHRRLHLVDVENLIGNPRPTLAEAAACRERYSACAPVACDDLVVVACNHGAALAVGLGWRGDRLLLRSGQDGAERALLDVVTKERPMSRFAEVVVGSGDGLFTDAVAHLGSQGIDVTVVSNRRSLSRRLELAAKHVVIFDAPVPTVPAAALRRVA